MSTIRWATILVWAAIAVGCVQPPPPTKPTVVAGPSVGVDTARNFWMQFDKFAVVGVVTAVDSNNHSLGVRDIPPAQIANQDLVVKDPVAILDDTSNYNQIGSGKVEEITYTDPANSGGHPPLLVIVKWTTTDLKRQPQAGDLVVRIHKKPEGTGQDVPASKPSSPSMPAPSTSTPEGVSPIPTTTAPPAATPATPPTTTPPTVTPDTPATPPAATPATTPAVPPTTAPPAATPDTPATPPSATPATTPAVPPAATTPAATPDTPATPPAATPATTPAVPPAATTPAATPDTPATPPAATTPATTPATPETPGVPPKANPDLNK